MIDSGRGEASADTTFSLTSSDTTEVESQRVGPVAHEESRLWRSLALNELLEGVHPARSASLEKNRVIELLHVVHEMLMQMVI